MSELKKLYYRQNGSTDWYPSTAAEFRAYNRFLDMKGDTRTVDDRFNNLPSENRFSILFNP